MIVSFCVIRFFPSFWVLEMILENEVDLKHQEGVIE